MKTSTHLFLEHADSFIANILISARTTRGWSPEDLSRQSQTPLAVINKIERFQHIPSMSEWQKLAAALRISLDSIQLGFIDNVQKSALRSEAKENGFIISERFQKDRCLKVRELLPYFAALIESSSWNSFNRWLESLGFTSAFIYNLDNQVNLHFYEKLVIQLYALGITDLKAGTIAEYSANSSFHGRLWENYRRPSSSSERVRAYVQSSEFYQCAFSIEVIDELSSPEQLTIECTPAPFLFSQLQNYLPETLSFLDIVRENWLLKVANAGEAFGHADQKDSWDLEEIQSIYQGQGSSIYVLSRMSS